MVLHIGTDVRRPCLGQFFEKPSGAKSTFAEGGIERASDPDLLRVTCSHKVRKVQQQGSGTSRLRQHPREAGLRQPWL